MNKITVSAILGPTAAGKTEAALSVAEEYGYEVLSCDSRQIYRHMDIGTAKPSLLEMGRVRHHLVDILNPSEPYSAFAFAEDALRIIREAHKIGKKILICGGAGLYYDILVNGGGSSLDEADLGLRDRMLEEAQECGSASLHDRLRCADPEAAEKIHPNDLQRILRALDVYCRTGQPLSSLRKDRQPPEDVEFRAVVISLPREVLYDRINRRVDAMVERGLWNEFVGLREMGYTEASPGMACVGYRELFGVEKGEMGLEQAVESIKRNTRRYAKRQMTWFRNRAPGVLVDVSGHDVNTRFIVDLMQGEELRA